MQAHFLTEERGGEYQIYDATTKGITAQVPTDIPAALSEEETES
jgi:hypothetical protein